MLPSSGTVLEIASGTGEHAVWFAEQLPGLVWQPSDVDEGALGSIAAWIAHTGLGNVKPPLRLDVCQERWPVARGGRRLQRQHDPHRARRGQRGAHARRRAGDRPPAACWCSTARFASEAPTPPPATPPSTPICAQRDPRWGVRDLEAVVALARAERPDARGACADARQQPDARVPAGVGETPARGVTPVQTRPSSVRENTSSHAVRMSP